MRWLPLLALLVCCALAGCANSDNRSEDNRFGGAYGGLNGGMQ